MSAVFESGLFIYLDCNEFNKSIVLGYLFEKY